MFKRIIKPEMFVLDIGANMGYYSLLSVKLMKGTGKIISFEPTSEGFKRLKTNVLKNSFKDIFLEKIGISNENKELKAKIRSSWKMKELEDPIEEEISLMKLDDYVKQNKLKKIDFIKIDVDGYGYEILKGAKNTLEKHRPILCIEMGNYENSFPRYNLREITSFLKSLGVIIFIWKTDRRQMQKRLLKKGKLQIFF